ncbi:MAG TPA: AzlC family ABC transporter permease [Paracoccus sp. (in: a-proteobacteria)]|nr:AzlC family ABC transporter permease [Paracoccus sp. (in: a-proteobacteria)]
MNSPAADISPAEQRALARTLPQSFRHGVVQALPFLLVLVPFALLFGVVATGAGLDILQTMGFSVLVLAGASQFTAVQLMTDHAPVLLVLASSLAVNLRMAMYSASLTPWLGAAAPWQRAVVAYLLVDQTYGLGIQHFEANPRLTVAQRFAYFLGTSVMLCPPWMLFTLIGATAGNAIPAHWPLDFAIPITFLAMIAPMLRTPAHLAAALVAILSALAFAGLPSGTGLLLASALGMGAGAWVETVAERRRIGGRG